MHARVAIIGAGVSGLGMAIRLRREGIEDFVVLEKADDVGGTWRDNTYPGCQCDIPSYLYSYSFAPNPEWTRAYPRQDEIRRYLRDTAESYGLREKIRFGAELEDAAWDEDAQLWRLRSANAELTSDVLVMAAGGLSAPSQPLIRGISDFEGTIFHSAEWNHEHELSGERVAVIGTGASAIQFVPEIQPKVGRLQLFQRTPPWVLPDPDRRIGERERRLLRRVPLLRRALRGLLYWAHELTVLMTIFDRRLARFPERRARHHLRNQVPDRDLRRKLRPSYTIGCKRILLSDTYYPALTQPNAEVITEPISEIRAHSIATADGEEHEVDTVILGTGFHVHDNPSFGRIRGRGGRTLGEEWNGSPRAYLGSTVPGFPNFFILVGPNSAGGFNSIIFTSESHINYVIESLREMDRRGIASVEVRRQTYERFNRATEKRLAASVWNSGGCDSWYLDGKGRNGVWWPGFTWRLWQRTRRFDLASYDTRRPPSLPAADGARQPVASG